MKRRQKIKKWVAVCSVFVLIYAIGMGIYFWIASDRALLQRTQTQAELVTQGRYIQYAMETMLSRANILEAYIQLCDGQVENFEEVSQIILEDPRIKSVSLSPGGVLEYVYPAGSSVNEMGTNLLSPESGNYLVDQKAVQTRQMTLVGPYDLPDLGKVFQGHLPVFLPGDSGEEEFWGLLVLTIDYDAVIDLMPMSQLEDKGYYYSISRTLSHGGIEVLAQSPGWVSEDYAECMIDIFNATWYLRAVPMEGWISWVNTVEFAIACLFVDILLVAAIGMALRIHREMRERAFKDNLTQLYNRHYLEQKVKKLLQNPGKHMHYACILVDVDNFKEVNDTFGHQKGDEVLVDVAQLLQDMASHTDIVARLGGDEFVVFYQYSGEEEKLRQAVQGICDKIRRPVVQDGKSIPISSSIGVSRFSQDGEEWEVLLKKADDALYECKRRGKDGFCIYQITKNLEAGTPS